MGEPWSVVQPKPLASLTTTFSNSVEALGQGFDITADSRLLYCKGTPGSRLVRLSEPHRPWDFIISEVGVVLPGIPADVDIVSERPGRETAPFCSFLEDKEKQVLMVVIPLQVIANIARVAIGESGPYARDWVTLKQIFLLVVFKNCSV